MGVADGVREGLDGAAPAGPRRASGEGGDTYDDRRYLGLFPHFWAFGQALAPCRVSLVVGSFGAGVLLVPDQMAEALTSLCDRPGALVEAGLVLSAIGWGLTSWYFARQMLRFAYPSWRELPKRVESTYVSAAKWLPRFLGVAPSLATSVALLRCRSRTAAVTAPALWLLGLTFVLGAFVIARRPFLKWMRTRRRRAAWARSSEAQAGRGPTATHGVITKLCASFVEDLDDPYEPKNRRLGTLPLVTQALLLVHVLVFAALATLFTAWPVQIAPAIGAPTVLLLALSSWVVAGSAIAYLASWLRLPLSLLLVAWAIAISRRNDDHVAVPLAPSTRSDSTADVAKDFHDWQTATNASPGDPYIVVATEGGGIRAAYFTAAILAALEERYPRFDSRLYAMSSVSGGSLGAAVFAALVHQVPPSRIRGMAAEVLGDDALAPPLAKLLFPELFQRLWPTAIPAFDRGRALEQAWAQSFGAMQRRHPDVPWSAGNPFDASFDALWTDPALPRLFLNATSVETGERVVFGHPVPPQGRDIVDGLAYGEFTLAQVVHDSARFPYVSPAATFVGRPPALATQHVVDGGYFENSGAATALDVIDAVGQLGRPHVLVIRYVEDERAAAPLEWATELVVPPVALYRARDARGELARLTIEVRGLPHRELPLSADPSLPPFPLGWMLSADARARIDAKAKEVAESPVASDVGEWLTEGAAK